MQEIRVYELINNKEVIDWRPHTRSRWVMATGLGHHNRAGQVGKGHRVMKAQGGEPLQSKGHKSLFAGFLHH